MRSRIQGMTVTLRQNTGHDEYGNPQHGNPVTVDNVLVGEPTTDEITSSVSLYGKVAELMIAIPKGDVNDWEDALVEIGGKTYRTFGFVIEGIEENIHPEIPWHKKVRAERYG